jgi:ligand-binding sensor domain-containing protein/DNA-binding CsgD family transcriptional regulator
MTRLHARKTGLLLCILLCCRAGFGQNPIGLPVITNYLRSDYNAGLQNRGVAQDKNGILYFANSEGLLSFDGNYWQLYPLPNKTMVRSVAIGNDQKIYVGGQNEMGYFSPDKNGSLVFTSLKTLLPAKDREFRDIWNIVPYGNQLYFRSLDHIFQFDYHTLTDYRPLGQWQFLGACNGRLYAEDSARGLCTWTGGAWLGIHPAAGQAPPHLAITAIVPLSGDSLLVATLKNGLFTLSGKHISPFKMNGPDPFLNQEILCAMRLNDGAIALGTHMGGLYLLDKNGHVSQNLSRKEGLQNNTVLALFADNDHNLWMGLDDGIDFDACNSAIKHIYPERLNEGAGYSALVFNKKLYIGTSNWLYELPVTDARDLSTVKGDFKPVAGTKGSAWGLFNIGDNLLLAHHEGAFQVRDDKATPIDTHFGFWNFTALGNLIPGADLLAGNYNGLDRLRYTPTGFISEGNLNFSESSRYVIAEKQTAWVAHNYKGIYKIDFSSPSNPVIRVYTDKNGLPSSLKNRLFRIKNRMAVATGKGIYEYNARTDRFQPSAYFAPIFGRKDLRYLKEDDQGNIWFIEEKKLGVVDFSGPAPRLIYFPELNGKLVSDFENIYPLNEENIFVGAEKGFYHINYAQYTRNRNSIRVLVRAVKTYGDADSTINGGYTANGLPSLGSRQNNLHFEFAAPAFQIQSNIQYSCLLSGFDRNWSLWSKKSEKDYTNLPEGRYTFDIKARGNLGDESAVTSYTFTVLPPWYRSWWAYAVYGLIFINGNYLFYRQLKKKFRRQKLKYEEEQKRLNYLHQLELDKSEKEIIALKNERLESEILGKNSELAAIAMHLLQKSELLTTIREELVHLRKTDNNMPSEELKRLTRILDQESKMDKDWEQFAGYFDKTHHDFLKALKEQHPLLSAHELKLCAYLKMNLSSKEIAQLLNISVRGVEIGRYRLRKKLGIPTEINLFDYFMRTGERKKVGAGKE